MRRFPKEWMGVFGDGFGHPVQFSFRGTLGPHGTIVRATYSPPEGTIAVMVSSSSFMVRTVVGAPAGFARLRIRHQRNSEGSVNLTDLAIADNLLNVIVQAELIHNLVLQHGDTVSLESDDSSTGGTIRYLGVAAIVEFDL